MLNRTTRRQVDEVRGKLFARYPSPFELAGADERELVELLRPLGLYNRRAKTLKALSGGWLDGFDCVTELPGVGRYAHDSWRIFQEGDLSVAPDDKALKAYLRRCRDGSGV